MVYFPPGHCGSTHPNFCQTSTKTGSSFAAPTPTPRRPHPRQDAHTAPNLLVRETKAKRGSGETWLTESKHQTRSPRAIVSESFATTQFYVLDAILFELHSEMAFLTNVPNV